MASWKLGQALVMKVALMNNRPSPNEHEHFGLVIYERFNTNCSFTQAVGLKGLIKQMSFHYLLSAL